MRVYLAFLFVVPLLQAQIGYQAAADADAKKTLLLRDFQPATMLHAEQHPVTRAKYPVIDVHQHVNDAMGIDDVHVSPQHLLAMMDRNNIKTLVILSGRWGEKLQAVLNESSALPGSVSRLHANRLEQNRRSRLQPENGDSTR